MGETDRKSDSLWNRFIARAAPPTVGLLLGFGGSQLLAVQQLRDKVLFNTQHIDHIDTDLTAERKAREEQDRETRQVIADARNEYLKAMERMSTRLDTLINQNTELIQLVKVQQLVKP